MLKADAVLQVRQEIYGMFESTRFMAEILKQHISFYILHVTLYTSQVVQGYNHQQYAR